MKKDCIIRGHLSGIVNRFLRTLNETIEEHFVATKKLHGASSPDKLTHNYNHPVNRGIGIEPFFRKFDAWNEEKPIWNNPL